MGKIHWYKRDPVAWLQGTRKLTPEQRGFYADIIELIMAHDGQLDDDDKDVAAWIRCTVGKWRKVKAQLIELGKISVEDGKIVNDRCKIEAESALKLIEKRSQAGQKSGEIRRQKAECPGAYDEHVIEPTTTTTTTTTTKEEEEKKEREEGGAADASLSPNGDHRRPSPVNLFGDQEASTPDVVPKAHAMLMTRTDIDAAVEAWNRMADRCGLPLCQRLAKVRRTKIAARLRDAGGLAGWCSAVERVESIPGLLGENDRGWRADIDWLLQEKSFTKLMEGAYDNWREKRRKSKFDDLVELEMMGHARR